MANEPFKAGQEAYLETGQVVEYVAKVADGHVVCPLYGEEGDEPHQGHPITVREVFAEAPVAKWSTKVEELRQQANELTSQLAALRKERADFDREEGARKERLERHGILAAVDNFLTGKVTHYVTYDHEGIAKSCKVDANARDGWGELSLIELRPKSGWSTEWVLRSSHIDFCTSQEEIDAAIQRRLDEACEAWRKHQCGSKSASGLAAAISRHGRVIPADVAEAARLELVKAAEASVAQYAERLAEAQAKLDGLRLPESEAA